MRRRLVLLALLGLAGCEKLIGGEGKAECASNADCPPLYECDPEAGRCVDRGRHEDAEVDYEDAFVPDAAVPDAAPPDAAPPDAAVGGFGPDGDCFPGVSSGVLERVPGTTVPRARCTPAALVWTAPGGDGALGLRYRLGPQAPDETVDGLELPDRPDLVVHGATALVPAMRDGWLNLARVDLTGDGAVEFVDATRAAQQQPATDGRTVAYVQDLVRGDGVTVRQVRLEVDGARTVCGAEDAHQWGPALVDGRVAWFERPLRGGPAELVLARTDCTVFLRVRLAGTIDAETRLLTDGRRLVWLATDPETRRRSPWTLDLLESAPSPQRPVLTDLERGNPVDLALHDGLLAVSSYRRGGHVLDVYRLEDGRKRTYDTDHNARQPSLSARHVLWAAQSGTGPWEIRHAALDDLR
jgi:hypothetical protein